MSDNRKSLTKELKTKRIPVAVTEREYALIRERSGSLSMSAYLLRAGLNETIPQRRPRHRTPAINRLTYLELSRISQALQQIADWCEQHRQWDTVAGFPDLSPCQDLNAQLAALRLAIAGVNPETLKEADWLT